MKFLGTFTKHGLEEFTQRYLPALEKFGTGNKIIVVLSPEETKLYLDTKNADGACVSCRINAVRQLWGIEGEGRK